MFIYMGKNEARPGRLELPTYGFEVQRSIQLSYGRAPKKLILAWARI